jgi:hypothetical protein
VARRIKGNQGVNGDDVVDRWRRLIEEQAGSGQTQVAFCKQRGLPFHRFHYWKYEKLPALDAGPGTKVPEVVPAAAVPPQGFVPVEVVFGSGSPTRENKDVGGYIHESGVEVLLPRGVRVGLRQDFDGAVLRRVVEVLGC